MTRWTAHGAVGSMLLAAVALIGACGGGAGREDPAIDDPEPAPPAEHGRQQIGEKNIGHIWPLTVHSGTIACEKPDRALFTAPDGETYALNERAADADHPDIAPLRADGANGEPISLGALRSKAVALCND
ncbi:hypothetical protein GCM10009676_13330 [Prauserella halophila]|uniref:DUF2511 domain-containing protein n=1 Tax=Prauserella halophila TaxID=185641 RepID=A0ABN1W707_9PSEU|nr:hypothetical protein [Prauserella halophila]MCP2236450.1 Protein of unknown function (DUF2511) [Prauserella halophila]